MAGPLYFAFQYTTADEMRRVLTDQGFDLRNQDSPDDTAASWWCNKATGRVQYYFEKRYAFSQYGADLAANPFVREVAAVFAARFFAGKGGECPNGELEDQYKEAVEILDQIRIGEGDIPGFDPDDEKGAVPTVSGMVVDMQSVPALRVDPNRSTGKPAGYTQRKWFPAYWNGPV